MRAIDLAGVAVLVVDGDGPVVGVQTVANLLQGAMEAGARTVAIAVGRLDPEFFELRSGIAGEMVQRFANYRCRLVVVGELPGEARDSRSFSGLVREGNRGDGPWFVMTLDGLAERLARRLPPTAD